MVEVGCSGQRPLTIAWCLWTCSGHAYDDVGSSASGTSAENELPPVWLDDLLSSAVRADGSPVPVPAIVAAVTTKHKRLPPAGW